MGRLTRDPEVRYSQGENPLAIARYTLAVDRRQARNNGGDGQTADFINCVAFGRTGEFAERYTVRGFRQTAPSATRPLTGCPCWWPIWIPRGSSCEKHYRNKKDTPMEQPWGFCSLHIQNAIIFLYNVCTFTVVNVFLPFFKHRKIAFFHL